MDGSSVVLDSVAAAAGNPAGGTGAGACGGPWELTRKDHEGTHGCVDGEGDLDLGRMDHLGGNRAPVGYEHTWGRALPGDPYEEDDGKKPRCC